MQRENKTVQADEHSQHIYNASLHIYNDQTEKQYVSHLMLHLKSKVC